MDENTKKDNNVSKVDNENEKNKTTTMNEPIKEEKKKKEKPKKKKKESKEKKAKLESGLREKLVIKETKTAYKTTRVVIAILALLLSIASIVLNVLELFTSMDYYTIALSGILLISGIILLLPFSEKVKHQLMIVTFVYSLLGILFSVAAYLYLSYDLIPSGLIMAPFVLPFVLSFVYFIQYPKKQKEEKVVQKEIIALADEQPADTKIKKVKTKTYKEGKSPTQKMFKNRLKFTNKFFRRLKSKAKGQIDVLINKDYFEAEKRAKLLLGITNKDFDQKILITVPDSFTNKDDVKYHLEVKEQGDNKLYFDQAYVTMMFYGITTLYIYQCNIDHRSGKIGHDHAQEFNYFDVLSVETMSQFDNDNHPKYSILNAELTLSNNQKFLIHLRNQRLHKELAALPLINEKERRVLQMLKDRIRASKV